MQGNMVRGQSLSTRIHYAIYVLCITILYFINLIRVNGNGAQWAFATEFVGPVIFLMILVRTGIKPFLKVINGVIVIGMAALFPVYYNYFKKGIDYDLQLIGRYISICLCVILIVHFLRENILKKSGISVKIGAAGAIWLILTALCIASRNQSFVPFYILIFFGSFYFLPISRDEMAVLIKAVVDGIIINFFIYQSLAFLHSPYDMPEYIGFFSNSDCNAKFYTVSYVGFLIKYSMLRRQDKKTRVVPFLFAGAMWGFMLFTVMRSAILAFILLTVVYLVLEEGYRFKRGFKGFFVRGIQLALVMIVSLPVIYVCIRYIPAFRHHPVFNGTYSEYRVHSWDPIDSEKYVSPEEFIAASFGKKLGLSYSTESVDFGNAEDLDIVAERFEQEQGKAFESIAETAELAPDGEKVIRYVDGVKPGTDSTHPMYVKISYNGRLENILGVRKYIFAGYISDMKFMGNREEYTGYWITCERSYTSSHCTYIDIASRYGYFAGVIYIVLTIVAVVLSLKYLGDSRREAEGAESEISYLFSACVFVACLGWGIFYSTVFWGEIIETMFWVALLPVIAHVNRRKYDGQAA